MNWTATIPRLSLLASLALVASACRAAGANEDDPAAPPITSDQRQPRPSEEAPPSNLSTGEPGEPAEGDTAPPAAQSATPAETTPERPRYMARKPPKDGVPRVYAKSRNVWIRGKPTSKTQWIGFLWFGSSVELRSPDPVAGHGCKTWYAIKPKGYVCVDEKKATLDPEDPELNAVYRFSPDPSGPTPHPHYGESIGAMRYHHPPSDMRMRSKEWDLRFHRKRIADALAGEKRHPSLIGVDLELPSSEAPRIVDLPYGMQEGHKELIPRSAVAWTKEFTHEGRAMVLADDLTWVPKDRLKIYPPIDFEGVQLSDDIQLPLAFFRKKDRARYRMVEGRAQKTSESFTRLSYVTLTEETRSVDGVVYRQTRGGDWLREEDAVIPIPRDETPWGAPMFEADTTGKAPKGRGSWIHVSILGGWLMAYEGTRPVFVTLMSPGEGGPPHGKIPTLKTASTPTGWFKITGKFVTSTMISPSNLVHSAVPWAQNFKGPYAIHSAYWHNRWGELMSGGCINVSPKDGKFLFGFTEPTIPEGWHGVRWLPKEEGSTGLIVER